VVDDVLIVIDITPSDPLTHLEDTNLSLDIEVPSRCTVARPCMTPLIQESVEIDPLSHLARVVEWYLKLGSELESLQLRLGIRIWFTTSSLTSIREKVTRLDK